MLHRANTKDEVGLCCFRAIPSWKFNLRACRRRRGRGHWLLLLYPRYDVQQGLVLLSHKGLILSHELQELGGFVRGISGSIGLFGSSPSGSGLLRMTEASRFGTLFSELLFEVAGTSVIHTTAGGVYFSHCFGAFLFLGFFNWTVAGVSVVLGDLRRGTGICRRGHIVEESVGR